MKNHRFKQFILCIMLLSASLVMLSCNNNDDGDPRDGLLNNETPYNMRVNFMGVKISEVPSEEMVRENALEDGTTYQVQVSLVDSTGVTVEILPILSLYINRSADDNYVDDVNCSWYLSVFGQSAPFSLTSGS